MIQEKRNRPEQITCIIENVLITSSVIIFTLQYTIFGVLDQTVFSPIKNVVMILITLFFIYLFFTVSNEERKLWFTEKFLHVPSFVWLMLYFAVRCITFIHEGMDYSIAREVFFEFVFLVMICRWTVNRRYRVDIMAYIFCGINLLMNIGDTAFIHLIRTEEMTDANNGLIQFLLSLSSNSPYGPEYTVSLLYVNPNSAGIMTALALLFSLILYKNRKYLPVFIIYWAYSLFELVQYESRGAMLSLIVAGVSILLMMAIKKLTPRALVVACFVCCIVLSSGMYGFIEYNLSDGDKNLTDVESMINDISTQRYKIWQDCVISHSDKKLLGTGSPSLEEKERNEYLRDNYVADYGTDDGFVPTKFSVHNGYLAAIFITGWLGYMLFIIIMLDKLRKAEVIRLKNRTSIIFASIIIFIFMVCNFEALLITSRYYTVLILYVLLALDYDKERTV